MNMKFNKFLWGFATNSFQIEGGRNLDDRTFSIWDHFTNNNKFVPKDKESTAREIKSIEIASDFYHKYPLDFNIMDDIGVNLFSYYVDWARIMPRKNKISKKGLDFYKKVFANCLKKNIEPMITLYHWDTPLWLEKIGGLKNTNACRESFQIFAKALFQTLGEFCKLWVVSSENLFTIAAYLQGIFPPNEKGNYYGFFQAFHTLNVMANQAKKEFDLAKQAQILSCDALLGTDFDYCPGINLTPSRELDTIYEEWNIKFPLQPVFEGTYPQRFFNFLDRKKIKLDYSKNDLNYLQEHSLDFICWNYYRPQYFQNPKTSLQINNMQIPDEIHFSEQFNLVWPKINPLNQKKVNYTKWNWLIEPNKLVEGLKKINHYYNKKVIIGENGYGDIEELDADNLLYDYDRIDYLKIHIEQIMLARQASLNLIGYCIWTYCDIFSPSAGYRKKYGVVNVDFNSPSLPRSPKLSYIWYKKVIKTDGEVLWSCQNSSLKTEYKTFTKSESCKKIFNI